MASDKQEALRRLPKLFRVLQTRIKLVIAAASGAVVAFFLPAEWRPITRALVGWDAAVVLYLVMVYRTLIRSEMGHIRGHAIKEDEGRVAVLVLTVTATLASLAAIVALLGEGAVKMASRELFFAIATILLSWAFVHTIFALHYAHEFYTGAAGGLEFPGGEKPDYWDFVYFSFVLGMTFQVSDVAVTSHSIRRVVLAHSIVSFLYNVALLAIVVNIAAAAI